MTGQNVAISKVAEVNPRLHINDKPKPQDTVSFVPMASVSEETLSIEAPEDRPYAEVAKGYTPFQRGDIILAKITPCFENGKMAHATQLPHRQAFGSTEFHVIRPGKEVDGVYLFHLLRDPYIRRAGQMKMKGAAGQRRVPAEFFANLKIPLPPLAEQKRIAAILDAADALRAKRRETLAQLDTLLQSTFLDLFGDPVTNPKGWEVSSLDRVITVEHGFAFKSEYFSDHGDYIVLTPGSFYEDGGYRNQGSKTKYYAATPPEKYILPAGELLVAMTEQAPGLLGSPIFVPENDRFLHNQRLGRIRIGERLTAQFVYHLFNTPWVRGELQRTSTGTKVKHTSPTKIGAVTSIVPPPGLQRHFATIVESIERQKTRLRAHLAELDTLFASLQSRAFNGAL
ncbi:hypothetical protein BI364_06135 [Acidihalobacter yilgarnensis]|uniref:Type I restriction modification DNA specificity domain-containing protein n=1 Tax=Acidihalobacter yilgarnensis TaxID=2819280 RepID=A0A1D8IM96_9GAMM|nr:restriction endonuclease subunit S [Acidihalobacter yilgarnensis]AOU97593.1 hypothetical protein BI364_06135 [Acidihalobacter yilgarnensis]